MVRTFDEWEKVGGSNQDPLLPPPLDRLGMDAMRIGFIRPDEASGREARRATIFLDLSALSLSLPGI